ncbi:hypothetical protein PC129_g4050 [Phytophthora cactorum]|uniref:Uncharacterized protein n=1 Tax=Phytophthora cactorum TaxID=29920 RepID=A0A329RY38_9STRA|nr:hypothetical protein Pcac1_g3225 [Phytophthora cactorum]KAG2815433.1 hypothetical protein PC111_g13578 [Phytophthora cactorum]KAG2815457.1 hypothetical protein PC112_g13869 [Phytophthora cactorum]KAG2853436.1 hypothetical protein PC113_g14163 [Phytophthora cactorum]KAG2896611.1 hypothetical protein PC114_g15012 [Phytophthora cactorum]
MQILALVVTGAAVLAFIPAVHGHGFIVDPAAQWFKGYPDNGYGSTVDNEIWGLYDFTKYGYGQFIAKNQELYSSDVDPDCGWTVYKDSARSELPASQIEYTGFTHPGPCEIWCDDTKLLFDYDCWTKYPEIPAKIPYDKSKCANANRLTIYWIGIHGVPWQIYTDCVWLEGGSGRGAPPSAVGAGASTVATGSSSSSTPTTTTAPASLTSTTTTAPDTNSSTSTETAGEASTSVDEIPKATTAPATPTTEDDTPATEAPSIPTTTASAKCSRRN